MKDLFSQYYARPTPKFRNLERFSVHFAEKRDQWICAALGSGRIKQQLRHQLTVTLKVLHHFTRVEAL